MPAPVMQARRRAPSTCSASVEICASLTCGAAGASGRSDDSRLTRVVRRAPRAIVLEIKPSAEPAGCRVAKQTTSKQTTRQQVMFRPHAPTAR
eukprot:3764023-Prymnesium_polylepis.1